MLIVSLISAHPLARQRPSAAIRRNQTQSDAIQSESRRNQTPSSRNQRQLKSARPRTSSESELKISCVERIRAFICLCTSCSLPLTEPWCADCSEMKSSCGYTCFLRSETRGELAIWRQERRRRGEHLHARRVRSNPGETRRVPVGSSSRAAPCCHGRR